MAMVPSPRKPGNGRVPTPRVPGKPVKGPGQVVRPVPAKPPARKPSPLPPGYIRTKDSKGAPKVVKAKPGTSYLMGGKSTASKSPRKPR